MKFRKFGKALLMTAISAGVVFGVYVLRAKLFGRLSLCDRNPDRFNGWRGVISGFKIDHNTGNLSRHSRTSRQFRRSQSRAASCLSGGRAIPLCAEPGHHHGWRSMQPDGCLLERQHRAVCDRRKRRSHPATDLLYAGAQSVSDSRGCRRARIFSCLTTMLLTAPDARWYSGDGTTRCGDITAFQVDSSTGRLSYVLNSQVTAASGSPLTYFPVPADPIDFAVSRVTLLTLSGTHGTGDSVFPYAYNAATDS